MKLNTKLIVEWHLELEWGVPSSSL